MIIKSKNLKNRVLLSLKLYDFKKNDHVVLIKKQKLTQQYEVLENMDVFLTRSYSLTETLRLLEFRYDLSQCIEDISEGKYLSESLRKNKYDSDALLMIEIGETSGNLALGVKNATNLLEDKIKHKNQMLEILKYPLLLAVILIVALGFVGLFLIPQFKQIYISFNIDVGFMMSLVFYIIRFLPLLVLIILITILMMIIYIQTQNFETRMRYYFKNKFVALYYTRMYNQIFVINLVNLLKVGLKIDEVMVVLSNQKYNLLLSIEAKRILVSLNEGYDLSSAIDTIYYTEELKMLIREGETQSTLVHNLENYVIYLQKAQKSRAEKFVFLIQPIFYGIFGLLIIILYVSIFVPMFKMMDSL